MHDLVIVGGGPGGLTAGIYAKRALLDTVLLEKMGIGGQIVMSDVIENYPGFKEISGPELMKQFEEQAKSFGLEVRFSEVTRITDKGGYKELETSEGIIEARAVVICSGSRAKRLGVPGESEFTGRGVSFCATCDGFFFKNREVAVIGGGDTALKEGLFLSKLVKKVHLVHRRDELRGEKINQQKAKNDPKFEFHLNKVVEEVKGDFMGVQSLVLKDTKSGEVTELAVEGVFVFIGWDPNTGFIEVEKDAQGFIRTNMAMATSMPGVFAAGDCRHTPLRQVATAVGDGAIAAYEAEQYIETHRD